MLDQTTFVAVLHKYIGISIGEEKPKIAKRPGEFVIDGILERGSHTQYRVDGEEFEINESTWIVGRIQEGVKVRIKGHYRGGKRFASRILVF